MELRSIYPVSIQGTKLGDRQFHDIPDKHQHSEKLDRHTLIYDSIISPCGKYLRILCPALPDGNIRLSFSLQSAGGEVWDLRTQSYPKGKTHLFTARVPRPLQRQAGLKVHINCNGEALAVVPVTSASADTDDYCLITLQKDNEPEWIYDWALYHHALGITHLILYDNGSKNLKDVVRALDALPATLRVTVVNWPFPYGLHPYNHTFLAQTGAIQHALHTHPRARWAVFMDIDEYLLFPQTTEGSLRSLLDWLPWHTGGIRFQGYNFPNIGPVNGSKPRAFHYTQRSATPNDHGHKYAVRPKTVNTARVHGAKLYWPYKMRNITPADMAFAHFLPITTGWKAQTWDRKSIATAHPEYHQRDERVIAMFERLNGEKISFPQQSP